MHRCAVFLLNVEGISLSALNESIPGPLHGLLDIMIDMISMMMMTTTTMMMMMIMMIIIIIMIVIMMMMMHVWPFALIYIAQVYSHFCDDLYTHTYIL